MFFELTNLLKFSLNCLRHILMFRAVRLDSDNEYQHLFILAGTLQLEIYPNEPGQVI